MPDSLGKIDLVIQSDEAQVTNVSRKAGRIQADQITQGVARPIPGAAGGGLSAPIIAAAAVAGLVVTVQKVRDTLRRWDRELDQQSKQLARVTPLLAASQAMSTIADIERDIRSGQRLGPALFELDRARDRFKDSLRELTDAINEQKARLLTGVTSKTAFTLRHGPQIAPALLGALVRQAAHGIDSAIAEAFGLRGENANISVVQGHLKTMLRVLDGIRRAQERQEQLFAAQNVNEKFTRGLFSLADGRIRFRDAPGYMPPGQGGP